jgi:CobQ-like glutamine amidotransferase family enzyme
VRAVKLAVLYPRDFNLNADVANLHVIRRRLELTGHKVTVEEIDSDFTVRAGNIDFLMIGSPSSSILESSLADVGKFRTFASEIIQEQAVVLAVSRGLHLFGSIVDAKGGAKPSLGLLDFQTTFADKQNVTIAAEVSTDFGSLIGIENHNATLALGPNAKPLGRISFGVGNNKDGLEGYHSENFFGTHFHGPLLALNSNFANEIVSRVVQRAGGAFDPTEGLSRLDSLSEEARLHLVKRRV